MVKVPINDSLTEFKFVGLATAGTGFFGSGSASVRTRQDLQLISGLPPVVRENDSYAALFTVRNGTLDALSVRTKQLFSALVFSREMKGGNPLHGNHVMAIPAGEETDAAFSPKPYGTRAGDSMEAAALAAALRNDSTLNPVVATPNASDGRTPTFNDEYVTVLLETMSQQQLRNDAPATHSDWNWRTDGLLAPMNSNQGYPWPGPAAADLRYTDSSDLRTPSSTPYNSLVNSADPLTLEPKSFKFLKKSAS
jgi:hypothetical protein